MRVIVNTVRAFTKGENGGNPAGVVMDADRLLPEQMQRIAVNVKYPETAFVQSSTKARLKILFFTPKEPIELCGHATVATLSLLMSEGRLREGDHTLETVAGVINTHVGDDGRVFYEQTPPTVTDYRQSR